MSKLWVENWVHYMFVVYFFRNWDWTHLKPHFNDRKVFINETHDICPQNFTTLDICGEIVCKFNSKDDKSSSSIGIEMKSFPTSWSRSITYLSFSLSTKVSIGFWDFRAKFCVRLSWDFQKQWLPDRVVKSQRPCKFIVYAWHPLTCFEICGEEHI